MKNYIYHLFGTGIFVTIIIACSNNPSQIRDYLANKYINSTVVFENRKLKIKIFFPLDQAIHYNRMLLVHRNLIYELKDYLHDINNMVIENISILGEEKVTEMGLYSKENIDAIVSFYEENLLKYEFSRYILDSLNPELFIKYDNLYLTIKSRSDTIIDYSKPGFASMIDSLADECKNKSGTRFFDQLMLFKELIILGPLEINQEEINRLDYFFEKCE